MGHDSDMPGAAHLALVQGALLLHPETSVFDAMLVGWRTQQQSRLLSPATIADRDRMVRRFHRFTGDYPWKWAPDDVEAWSSSLMSKRRARSTVRNYQIVLGLFMAYVTDPRYRWAVECQERFGEHPIQICHEWNTADHLADYEGGPGRRPFSRDELMDFFEYADERVAKIRSLGRKGWLPAFRDAVLFKVIYAWGLRRREAVMLDIGDFSANAAAPHLGRFGMLRVRYGKAMRGGPPRRRNVATVMPWAVEVVEEYLTQVRPCCGQEGHPAMWFTERGARMSVHNLSERFVLYRRGAGLSEELTAHSLRHSYVSHQVEEGTDPLFIQQQVGHSTASSTAIYTSVSTDYKNRMMRKALERAWEPENDQ